DLEELTVKVIDSVTPTERDVRDRQGRAYSLRVRPYKNIENRIEGAVLTLFEVEPGAHDQRVVRQVRDAVGAMLDAVRPPRAVLRDERPLVHELEVQREQLAVQRDQLIRVGVDLARSRDRYADLFDFSPTGFLVLDRQGILKDVNLTGARMLGAERKRLIDF